jgi:hypothetical protein
MPYRLLIDPAGVEQARAELARVQRSSRPGRIGDDPAASDKAAEQVAAAEAAVDACYEIIMLHALPPARVEKLEAEHPPTADQLAKAKADREQATKRGEQVDAPTFNDDTYWPALLAECATDAGMGADDWAAFLAEHVSTGELVGLKMAALNVNRVERVADPLVLPKGWTPTIS